LTPFSSGGGAVGGGPEVDICFSPCGWVCACVVGFEVTLINRVASPGGMEAKGGKGVIGDGV
jgi:hypothetical protein